MLAKFFQVLQILSIDIVLGAVILLHFFCSYFDVVPSRGIFFLLGVSVWLIYTIDHLRDARNAPKSQRIRYQFHLKHQRVLRFAIGLLTLVNGYFLLALDQRVLMGGAVLAIFAGIYLVLQDRLARIGLKELYVALIYTAGILLTPFVLGSTFSYTVFALLFLLTYSNLVLFSWFEKNEDVSDKFYSIATVVKSPKLEKVIFVVLSLGLSIAVLAKTDLATQYFSVAFVIYLFLFAKAKALKKRQLYRWLGDGVFVLPALFCLL